MSEDGYYRVEKGYINGEKINDEWILEFCITYGGKNSEKYKMVSDAEY